MSEYKLNKVVLLTKEMRSNEKIRDQWTIDASRKATLEQGYQRVLPGNIRTGSKRIVGIETKEGYSN